MRASKNFGRFVATARINTGTTCQGLEDDDGVDDEDDDGDDDDPDTPSHPHPPALLSQKLKVKATILPLLLNPQLSQDPTCVLR